MTIRYGKRAKPRGYRKGKSRAKWQKYGAKAGSAAYTALKMARRLRDAVNIEYKYADTTSTALTPDYNGSYFSIIGAANASAGIPQGTTDTTRVGDSIKLQNLTMRYTIARNGQDAWVRVFLLWDPQNKIAAVSDVLQSTGSVLSVISPKNYDKRFQCKVLYEALHKLDSSGNALSKVDHVLSINKHTQFSAGSATAIMSGDIKMLVISNVVTTNLPTMAYYLHLTYTDD